MIFFMINDMTDNSLKVKAPVYDVPAEGYDELYGVEQLEKYEAVFGELGEAVKELKVVLDIGCATGLLGEYLRFIGFDGVYVGVDLLKERLTAAKMKAGSSWMLIQADAEHLPLRDDCVDLAASVTVIHLLDVEKALEEALRASKKFTVVTVLKKRLDLEPEIMKYLISRRGLSVKKLSLPKIKDEILIVAGEF